MASALDPAAETVPSHPAWGEGDPRARKLLKRCRRVVVKIGSRALARGSEQDQDVFAQLADQLASCIPLGRGKRRFCVVSSGAIALGIEQLGLRARPRAIDGLQAAAAAGQGKLMQRWGDALAAHQLVAAQVLLTHADLSSRLRANNARAALARLLELGAVPIINENDAVATDEIRFGDNDELASMVAPLCDADLLILLSDVDGLLDVGCRVPLVRRVDEAVRALVGRHQSSEGRGGMASKLEAARRAMLSGSHVVIASAYQPDILARILAGDDVGTLFPALTQRLSTRKHWIAYTLRPRGVVVVDRGASEAIRLGGRSVLCVGVIGVRGQFAKGDPLSIVDLDGNELARGLSRLSATDAAARAGVTAETSEPLIHRDDLVLLPG